MTERTLKRENVIIIEEGEAVIFIRIAARLSFSERFFSFWSLNSVTADSHAAKNALTASSRTITVRAAVNPPPERAELIGYKIRLPSESIISILSEIF